MNTVGDTIRAFLYFINCIDFRTTFVSDISALSLLSSCCEGVLSLFTELFLNLKIRVLEKLVSYHHIFLYIIYCCNAFTVITLTD